MPSHNITKKNKVATYKDVSTLLLRFKRSLIKRFRIRTIVLFGSFGRGDPAPDSDIDLLIISSRPPLPSTLRKALSDLRLLHRPSLIIYSPKQVHKLWREGSLFLYHVLTEGHVLYDSRFFEKLKSLPFSVKPDNALLSEVKEQFDKLIHYRDLSRFNGNFLFCLTQFFSIYKTIAIHTLAAKGIFEFNKPKAFTKFYQQYPSLRTFQKEMNSLRAFYLRSVKASQVPLPFSYLDAEHKIKDYLHIFSKFHKEIFRNERKTHC